MPLQPIGGTYANLVTASRSLSGSDNGLLLECSDDLTLTLPVSLVPEFLCTVLPAPGKTVTVAPGAGTTIEGSGSSVTRPQEFNAAFTIYQKLSDQNDYAVTGSATGGGGGAGAFVDLTDVTAVYANHPGRPPVVNLAEDGLVLVPDVGQALNLIAGPGDGVTASGNVVIQAPPDAGGGRGTVDITASALTVNGANNSDFILGGGSNGDIGFDCGAGNVDGGSFELFAGSGPTGAGGHILLQTGDGATDGGDFTVTVGDGAAGTGGSLELTAGNGVASTGTGGAVTISSGNGGFAGDVTISANNGQGAVSYGGSITISAGDSSTSGAGETGGGIQVLCGDGGYGGDFKIITGRASEAAANGGDFQLILGESGAGGAAAKIELSKTTGSLADANAAQNVTVGNVGPGGAAISIKRWIPVTVDGQAGWIPHFGV